MSYKIYMLFRLLGILAIAFLGVWMGTTGNYWLIIPVVIIGTGVLFLLKRRVKEVVVDERINAVAYHASRFAYLSFVILAVIVGAILIVLNKNGSSEMFKIGLTLCFSVCALLVFYWLAYIYYNRKYGGNE